MDFDQATRAVVRVWKGRGFVVAEDDQRFIVTAAHCLPRFPPCGNFGATEDHTYASLIGHLGEKPTIWAECLFVNPIADVAVLCSPDNQVLFQEADDYEAFTAEAVALPVSEGHEGGPVWLLSLKGEWFQCKIDACNGGPWWLTELSEPIRAGMSGSPILNERGAAIGIVTIGSSLGGKPDFPEGPEARLSRDLPVWLAAKLMHAKVRAKRAAAKAAGPKGKKG